MARRSQWNISRDSTAEARELERSSGEAGDYLLKEKSWMDNMGLFGAMAVPYAVAALTSPLSIPAAMALAAVGYVGGAKFGEEIAEASANEGKVQWGEDKYSKRKKWFNRRDQENEYHEKMKEGKFYHTQKDEVVSDILDFTKTQDKDIASSAGWAAAMAGYQGMGGTKGIKQWAKDKIFKVPVEELATQAAGAGAEQILKETIEVDPLKNAIQQNLEESIKSRQPIKEKLISSVDMPMSDVMAGETVGLGKMELGGLEPHKIMDYAEPPKFADVKGKTITRTIADGKGKKEFITTGGDDALARINQKAIYDKELEEYITSRTDLAQAEQREKYFAPIKKTLEPEEPKVLAERTGLIRGENPVIKLASEQDTKRGSRTPVYKEDQGMFADKKRQEQLMKLASVSNQESLVTTKGGLRVPKRVHDEMVSLGLNPDTQYGHMEEFFGLEQERLINVKKEQERVSKLGIDRFTPEEAKFHTRHIGGEQMEQWEKGGMKVDNKPMITQAQPSKAIKEATVTSVRSDEQLMDIAIKMKDSEQAMVWADPNYLSADEKTRLLPIAKSIGWRGDSLEKGKWDLDYNMFPQDKNLYPTAVK